jgi:hypothetical protein
MSFQFCDGAVSDVLLKTMPNLSRFDRASPFDHSATVHAPSPISSLLDFRSLDGEQLMRFCKIVLGFLSAPQQTEVRPDRRAPDLATLDSCRISVHNS